MQIKVHARAHHHILPILTMMENSMVKAEINQYLDIAKHLTVPILRDAS